MKIDVSTACIEWGIKTSILVCPVALAISRTLGRILVHVYETEVEFRNENFGMIRHSLPNEVTDWIRAYDAGDVVAPISFELDMDKRIVDI